MPSSPDPARPPSTYRLLLTLPGAALFAVTAGAGRVGIAMSGFGLLLLARDRTGSYAEAGLAVAAFAVAEALAGPQAARLIDRWGQGRVVPALVLAHAAAVACLLLALTPVVATAAVAGATIPQLGALSAARWAALLRRRGLAVLLPAAFSLEALVNALAYLAGPVLVSVLAAAVGPPLGAAAAAALVVASGLGLALQRSTAPPAVVVGGGVEDAVVRADRGRRTGLLAPPFLAVLLVNLAVGVHFGAMPVAVAAFADARGGPGVAAVLLGLSGAAGLAAGWTYGRRRWRSSAPRQLAWLGAALVVACLLLAGLACAPTGPLPVAGAAVVLAGAVVPPVLVLSAVLTEGAVPARRFTQAMTWLNSASAAGSAAATALAGRAVDVAGAPAGFLLAGAAGAGLTVVAVLASRALRLPQPAAVPNRST